MLAKISIALVLQVVWSSLSFAQDEDWCRRIALPDASSILRYELRGHPPDRCEGLIQVERATTIAVRPVSFATSISYGFDRDDPVLIRWYLPEDAGGTTVRLQVETVRPETRYRMDTEVDDGSHFAWPTGVLESLRIESDEVGLLAWIDSPTPHEPPTYLPVSAVQAVEPGHSRSSVVSHQFAIIPGFTPRAVEAHVWNVSTDRRRLLEDVIALETPVEAIRPSLPIRFRIAASALRANDTYEIEVFLSGVEGAIASMRFRFNNSLAQGE